MMLAACPGEPQRSHPAAATTFATVGTAARQFQDRSRLAQVHRLRSVAVDALSDYPVRPSRVQLLAHAHNTTFRVDCEDGRRFALRVNVNSRSTAANLDAEMGWLTALAADTDIVVPTPTATLEGRLHTSRYFRELDRELSVVLMSWLPGPDLDRPEAPAIHELGRLMATMHDHAEGWSLPHGAEFPSHRDVLVGDPDRLRSGHPLLPADMHDMIAAALERTQGHIDEMYAASVPHAIHGDLHGGNLKRFRRRLAVFDFDDALIGLPLQDLGISSYYLRASGIDVSPLFDGYASVRPCPEHTSSQFEAVIAGRNLLLLNEILAAVSVDAVSIRETYVSNARRRLGAYLERDVYRFDVPGVVPLSW